ncbi:MAG: hypothetical protein IH899_11295 [Planctomycetes bacterium]|nr:hypothetical protein [Planctomycetota bacterium]
MRKLISPKAWKLWGIGVMGLLAGAALLRAGQFAAEAGSGTSDGFIRLFDPANGRALRVYGSVMLLLSGQLAMLIWWVRSRSPLDFGGRYRVWMKIAAAGVAASLFLITDFHVLVMELIQGQTGINRSIQLELCWLAPVAIFAAFLLRMMHQEMRENRVSLVLLWTAAASGLMTTLQIAGFPLPDSESDTQLVKAGTALFAQLGLMMSLLFHTRHVIYVSLDPPTKKSVSVRSLFRFRLPRLRLPRLRFPRLRMPARFRRTEIEKTNAVNQNEVEESSLREPTSAKQSRKKQRQTTAPHDSDHPSQQATTLAEHSSVSSTENHDSRIEEFAQNLRVDESIDNELLKGLSKKQRRKLRKQHRKTQRAASSRSPDIDDEN